MATYTVDCEWCAEIHPAPACCVHCGEEADKGSECGACRSQLVALKVRRPGTCDHDYEDILGRLRHEWKAAPEYRPEIEELAAELKRSRLDEQHQAVAFAVHEAGHAVAATALGYTVECVSRVSNPITGACPHVKLIDEEDDKVSCCDNALIAAASVALLEIAGVEDPLDGAHRDMEVVADLGHEWEERLTAAGALLLEWEGAAKAVVEALKEKPSLNAEEYAAVVFPVATRQEVNA